MGNRILLCMLVCALLLAGHGVAAAAQKSKTAAQPRSMRIFGISPHGVLVGPELVFPLDRRHGAIDPSGSTLYFHYAIPDGTETVDLRAFWHYEKARNALVVPADKMPALLALFPEGRVWLSHGIIDERAEWVCNGDINVQKPRPDMIGKPVSAPLFITPCREGC